MDQDSKSQRPAKFVVIKPRKRVIELFARKWNHLGWLAGVLYGYLVFAKDWSWLGTGAGFAVLFIIMHGAMDMQATRLDKEMQ